MSNVSKKRKRYDRVSMICDCGSKATIIRNKYPICDSCEDKDRKLHEQGKFKTSGDGEAVIDYEYRVSL